MCQVLVYYMMKICLKIQEDIPGFFRYVVMDTTYELRLLVHVHTKSMFHCGIHNSLGEKLIFVVIEC